MVAPAKPTRTKKTSSVKETRLNAEKIKTYLKRHPDFLTRHPDLVGVLTPPSKQHGKNVLDMQHFMIERLQNDLARAQATRDEVIAASSSNLSSQGRVHSAVLSLVAARSFEEFIGVITLDFPNLLDIDIVSLCIETSEKGKIANATTCGVRVLKRGNVTLLMGKNDDILLRSDIKGEPMMYGDAASSVSSDALIRLSMGPSAPPGLLALGSRDDHRFSANQGKELLQFLGGALSRLFGRWLYLPN